MDPSTFDALTVSALQKFNEGPDEGKFLLPFFPKDPNLGPRGLRKGLSWSGPLNNLINRLISNGTFMPSRKIQP